MSSAHEAVRLRSRQKASHAMTTDRQATVAVAPTTLPYTVRQRIFIYLGVLIIMLAFGSPHGGLVDIPISFFLKNKLHLIAHELAQFQLVAAIPLYALRWLAIEIGMNQESSESFWFLQRMVATKHLGDATY